MNQSSLGRVVHIVRSQTLGGSMLSSLRLAEAEKSLDRQVEVWVWLQKQHQEFDNLVTKYNIPIQRITAVELGSKLLSSYITFPKLGIINLQSGLGRLSPNLSWMRRLISPRTALVVTLRGPSLYEPVNDPIWQQEQINYSRFVSAIIVPSEMERQIRLEAGISPSKVFAVPNIIDTKSFQPGWLRSHLSLSSQQRIILFCGRITWRKSPVETILGFKSVINEHPDTVLVMAGDGELMPQCREAAASLGDKVHFLGHVNNVDDLYADADVFVGPSTAESFGRTAMEAALSQTPMVLGNIRPWTDYFTPGVDCEFVEPQNPDSIAKGIIKLLDFPDKSRQLAKNAQGIVIAKFSERGVLEALNKAYETALSS